MHLPKPLHAAVVIGLLALATPSSEARAAAVTQTYDFSFTNFVDVGGMLPPPITSISGSFTVTFDPSVYADNVTTGVVVNSLSDASVASPIGYTNFPAGGGFPVYLAIGGTANDSDYIKFGTDDFVLSLIYYGPGKARLGLCSDGYSCGTGAPGDIASGYTLAGYADDAWLPTTASFSVPEPATWATMLAGFGGLGLAMRAGRRRAAA